MPKPFIDPERVRALRDTKPKTPWREVAAQLGCSIPGAHNAYSGSRGDQGPVAPERTFSEAEIERLHLEFLRDLANEKRRIA